MSDTAMSTGDMTPQELKEQERAAKKAERARLKRVEMDEKAERKRAAKSGFANVSNPRRSKLPVSYTHLIARPPPAPAPSYR